MSDSEIVGKTLLKYRDNPPLHEAGTIEGHWYEMGEIMAIIMYPKTEYTTGEYLTRLAHLMGVDEGGDAERP